jgi:outer membrane protein assembly factor BamB
LTKLNNFPKMDRMPHEMARWTASLGRKVVRRAAVGAGRVYVGSGDGNLNALDAASGSVIWKTQNHLQHPFASNPYIPPMDTEPVYANGTLFYFNVEDVIALQVP